MKKEKYSLRKSNVGVVSAAVGLSVVGALSFGITDAHAADESTKPTDNKIEEKQTEKTNAEKLKDNNNEIVTVEKAIADSKNKQAAAKEAIAKVEKSIADNEALLEKSKKIEEANKKLESAEKEKAEAESKAKDTAAKLKDNSEEIATTEKNIKDNEAEKQKIATEIEEYEGTNVTEEEVNAKKAEIDKLEADLAAKTKEITTKKQENSKINIDELNKKIQDQDAKTEALKKEVENKKTEVDKLKEEINTPVTTEDPNLNGYVTKFLTSPEWDKAFREYLVISNESRKHYDAYQNMAPAIPYYKMFSPDDPVYEKYKKEWDTHEKAKQEEWDAYEKLEPQLNEAFNKLKEAEKTAPNALSALTPGFNVNNVDNTNKYKLSELPTDVNLRLNKYLVALINNVRHQYGIDLPLHVNTEAMAFANEVARATEKEGYTESNHFGRVINDAARKRGLSTSADPGVNTTNQSYENLMTGGSAYNEFTEKQLADNLYRYFHGFIYEINTTGHNGHMNSLLRNVQNIGLAFSRPGEESFKLHVINLSWEIDKEHNKNTNLLNYDIPNPGENVDKTELKTKLEKTEKELAELEKQAKSQELQARTNRSAKEGYLKFINVELPRFENETLPLLKQEIERATAIYNATKERFEHPEVTKAKFDELNAELTQINENLERQYKRLDELKKLKAALEQKYNGQKAEVESLTTSITNITNQLYAMPRPTKSAMELTADLNDARTTLANAEKDGKNEIERIKELTEKLAKLKAENTKLQNLIKLEETLKLNKDNTAGIPLVAPTTEALPEVTVNETTTTKPIDFKVVEKLDPTLEKGKRIVQTKGKQGSQKVTVTEFKLGDELLYTDEKLGDKVDPVDEVVLVGTKEVKLPQTPQRPRRVEETPQGEKQDVEVTTSGVEENNTTAINNVKQKALPKTSTEANNSLAGVGLVSLIALALAGRRKERR